MKLIVGLGNPGTAYRGTRHNIGRMAVEELARAAARPWALKAKLEASLAECELEGEACVLALPSVFMNLSGRPVAALCRHFALTPSKDLLIAVDDAALAFGRLRLRSRGSDGGHNGLKSVAEHLGSSAYARLRIGVGPGPQRGLEDFVLAPFEKAEKAGLGEVLSRAALACRLWATLPSEKAMNLVNAPAR